MYIEALWCVRNNIFFENSDSVLSRVRESVEFFGGKKVGFLFVFRLGDFNVCYERIFWF